MKAARLLAYNKEKIDLQIEEIAKPIPSRTEVLVEVKYAGVNPVDNMISRGEVKIIVPYKLPITAGNEFSGKVIAKGTEVTAFDIGDRVYARMPNSKTGAFAEFLTIDQKELAHIPECLSYEEAASVPLTALTAYQALDLLNVKSGESLFISGGSGGFGAMAIPLAKARGLQVITTGSARNAERVLALGADRYIDYQKEDFSQILTSVDHVIDTLGGAELEKQFSILKKGGHLVSLKGLPNKAFAKAFGLPKWKQFLLGLVGKKYDRLAEKNHQIYHFLYVTSNGEQLADISRIFQENKVATSIDSIFTFDQVNQALKKVDKGHSQGKTLLKIH
ncbi:NADP-dependent oxidoreductase [Streptococcus uberis]|uniref:NADP-dependent oxidoreductase n=1 Tax=Streptococcus uberis TaxID=1349 RepID=UPI003D77927E